MKIQRDKCSFKCSIKNISSGWFKWIYTITIAKKGENSEINYIYQTVKIQDSTIHANNFSYHRKYQS